MTNRDVFRPRHEPALTIYDAFQAEAKHRKGRTFDEWASAERLAVWRAASEYARQHGLREPLMAEVERAESYAMGSVDYGAKWAYQIERSMRPAALAPQGVTENE
jgi:hypothetical protein